MKNSFWDLFKDFWLTKKVENQTEESRGGTSFENYKQKQAFKRDVRRSIHLTQRSRYTNRSQRWIICFCISETKLWFDFKPKLHRYFCCPSCHFKTSTPICESLHLYAFVTNKLREVDVRSICSHLLTAWLYWWIVDPRVCLCCVLQQVLQTFSTAKHQRHLSLVKFNWNCCFNISMYTVFLVQYLCRC